MARSLVFRSGKFPPYEGEEEETNPGRWGKRLAEYLRDTLPQHGFVVKDLVPEDWGCFVEVENPKFPLAVACGHYQEWPDGYMCYIEPDKPFVRRWFRKVDGRPVTSRLAAAVEAIFQDDPEIRDVHWEEEPSELGSA